MQCTPPDSGTDLLTGGGEMGERVRAFDWASTPLGPIEDWPQSLLTTVGLLLNSRNPMFLFWGAEAICLYNNGYRPILGKQKHPRALGQTGLECWAGIWDIIGPQIEAVMTQGINTWHEDQLIPFDRNGYLEEIYFTYSYSPVRIESGVVGGTLVVCKETTRRVLGERRMRMLRDLGESSLANAGTIEQVCKSIAVVLADNQRDLPFALIYITGEGGQKTRLSECTGLAPGAPASPLTIDLESDDIWELREVAESGSSRLVDGLDLRFGPLPAGPWEESSSKQAYVVPISSKGLDRRPAGFLIVGLSPHLEFNDDYSGFAELVAGQIASAVATARAYTETQTRAEALAELDRAKTAFFSQVSHEFRTPLTLMTAPLEDVMGSEALPPEFRERLGLVHRNSLRLLKLVNRLLAVSSLEAGRTEVHSEPTDLSTLTEEMAGMFRSVVESAGLRLIVDCPPLAEPVSIDRAMWEKIVLNLLSNAFKFTFQGEIEVSLRRVEDRVSLSVRDTGTGIPSAELPHLFESFRRVKGARGRTIEGSGIGLAMVRELAKLLGGDVDVESTLGDGSRFTVSIPFRAAPSPNPGVMFQDRGPASLETRASIEEIARWLPDDTMAAGPDQAGTPGSSESAETVTRARILLADDNADMRGYLRRVIGDVYEVTAVDNGLAALRSAQAAPPDLVLADVMMPEMDGFDLLREMRADVRLKMVPVILLSARADEEARSAGMEAGADDYLVKPFAARELLARLKAHLQIARIRHESQSAIRQSEERFRALISVLTDVPWTTDAGGAFHTPQREWALYTGQSWEEHRDFGWTNAVHPDDRLRVGELWKQAVQASQPYRSEGRLWNAEKQQWRYFTARAVPLLDPGGVVREWVGTCTDIHEARLAEIERQAFVSLVEESRDFIAMATLDGRGLYVNHAGAALVGLESQEAVRTTQVAEYFPEESRKIIAETAIPAALGEGHWQGEVEFKHFQTGRLIPMRQSIILLRDPETGTALRLATVARDISQSKQAEKSLRESEERYRRIFSTADVSIWEEDFSALKARVAEWRGSGVTDLRAHLLAHPALIEEAISLVRVLDVNDAAVRLTGARSREELMAGLSLGPESYPTFIEEILAMEERRSFRAEAVMRTTMGDRLDVIFTLVFPADDPDLRSVLVSVMDISEEKRQERAIKESETRFRNMADHAPVMVWITDPSGACTYFSKSWYEYTGQSQAAALDFGWLEAVHPDDRQSAGEAFQAASEGRQPFRLEYRLRYRDGGYRWAIDAASPRLDSEGTFLGYIGSVLDITDRKKSEDELQQANNDLEQFAYSASHDLQEPLRAISIFSQLLAKSSGDQLDSQANMYLTRITDGATRMNMLIRDLSGYLHVAKSDEKAELVDATESIQAALEGLASAVVESGASVTWDPLPAIRVHGVRLQLLFQNLIGNAIKYHDPRRPPVIHTRAERRGGRWRFSVSDNGIGIASEHRVDIFKVFHRLHEKPDISGTGIGLAICQKIVESYGGKIWVESTPGEGTTFHFTLPAS